MLDLNLLRKEFAQHLLDNHGRFSFDQALYHALKKAYEKGLEDAQKPEISMARMKIWNNLMPTETRRVLVVHLPERRSMPLRMISATQAMFISGSQRKKASERMGRTCHSVLSR